MAKKWLGSAVLLASLPFCGMTNAHSADMSASPVSFARPVETDWQRWIIRMRVTGVWVGGTRSIWAGGFQVPDGKANVSRNALPELDVSYFMTRNLALSINATASRHKITGGGSISGLGLLGRTTVMAPALVVQYHFTEFGAFKPYIGVGGTQAFYFDHKDGALGNFKVRNAPGAVFQLGLDWMVSKHWGINFDLKKYLLRPDFTGSLGFIPVQTKINADPWLAGVGLAVRF